jgi:hypothetical protein
MTRELATALRGLIFKNLVLDMPLLALYEEPCRGSKGGRWAR